LVRVTSKLAYWQYRTGQPARLNYDESIRLAEQLVADFPDEPEAHFQRASVLMVDEHFGEAPFEEVIQQLRLLTRDYPQIVHYHAALAQALNNWANRLNVAGRREEANAAYQESTRIHRKLFEARPKDPRERHGLANALFNYGAFLRERAAEALPLRQEAGSLLRGLVQDFPSNLRYRHTLARNQNEVGLLLARLRRPTEAIPTLREAVLLMEQLPESYPFPSVRRWRLADFTKDLAAVLASVNQWGEGSHEVGKVLRLLAEAPALFKSDEAVRGFASGTVVEALRLLMRESDRHGRLAEARKQVDELRADLRSHDGAEMLLAVAMFNVNEGPHEDATGDAEAAMTMRPGQPNLLYDAACVFSLASGRVPGDASKAERYAKQAVELLRRSVAAGFQDLSHLKRDTDLAQLRDRPDYKELVTDLERKSPPK
jgi:tetratricopeptide (TPR) repeat protein